MKKSKVKIVYDVIVLVAAIWLIVEVLMTGQL
jgi:hypothetical protein